MGKYTLIIVFLIMLFLAVFAIGWLVVALNGGLDHLVNITTIQPPIIINITNLTQ